MDVVVFAVLATVVIFGGTFLVIFIYGYFNPKALDRPTAYDRRMQDVRTASNPNTSVQELRRLGDKSKWDNKLAEALVNNPSTPPDVARAIIRRHPNIGFGFGIIYGDSGDQ